MQSDVRFIYFPMRTGQADKGQSLTAFPLVRVHHEKISQSSDSGGGSISGGSVSSSESMEA